MNKLQKMLALVAVLAACSGCSAPRPELSVVDPPPRAAEATRLAWEALDGPGEPPVDGVVWSRPTCEGGIRLDDECPGGLTYSCDEIYVTVREYQRISRTLLVHELVHCLSLRRYDDMDTDHSRMEWKLVVPVKGVLAGEGM